MSFFSASVVTAKRPPSTLPRCGACGLLNTCKSPKLQPAGEGKRRILIVGEMPSAEDDYRGQMLAGRLADELRDALRRCDVDMDTDCWVTSAIVCNDAEATVPSDDQVDWCRPNLTKVIKELDPVVIIPLGWGAIRATLGPHYRESTGSADVWTGWEIPLQVGNRWVCPTYSLNTLDKAKGDREGAVVSLWFRRHIAAAVAHTERPWETVPKYESEVEVILHPEAAAAAIRNMVDIGLPSAPDYETNCLKPDTVGAKIISAAIHQDGRTIAFPFVGAVVQAMREYCLSPIKKIGANTKFEDRWSRIALGIERMEGFVWDCMLSAHHLDNRPGITSVKFQAFVQLGQEPWDVAVKPYLEGEDAVTLNRIEECDLRKLLVYNGMDSLMEFKIAEKQRNYMLWQNR